ncbi:MAG: efflux RND transporter permease subunit [Verrucomicrobiales bacterium]
MTGIALFQNPRLLLLLVGVIAVAGLSSLTTLPRMEDPILVQRIAVIRTAFPGADAERVESQISRVLEEDISKVKGIKEIYSESMAGISTISVTLKEDIDDVDTVWSLVRDELSEAAKSLPEGAREPEFRQAELKAFATIIALKWTGTDQANYSILGRLTDDLEGAVRSLPGTESIKIYGEPEEEILVQLPPDVLNRMGLTVGDVSSQIEDSESKASAGMYRGTHSEMVIELDEDFDSVKRLGQTPIRYGQDRLASLSDIARISKGTVSPPASLAIVDGHESVVTAVFVRNENRIDLYTETLRDVLDDFASTLPPNIELDVIFAQNEYVGERLDQLAKNLLLATLAVMVVVFLLMGWRSMIVVGAALPLSALMVLAGMRFLDIPIHQMSITGLIIALGLLIDNAIVIVDEVRSAMREGQKATDAISGAIAHLAMPLFGSTLTTTLAFMPIAILPGASGEFVGSIAVSVILAINASFLLAMTVVPALTALLQPAPPEPPKKKWVAAKDREKEERAKGGEPKPARFWRHGISNQRLAGVYRKSLVGMFRRPVLGLLLGISLPTLGFYQARKLPEQFFPPADRNQFHVELELPGTTSLARTRQTTEEIGEAILAQEGVSRVHWFIGESAPIFFYNLMPRRKNSPFYAQAMVELEPSTNPRNTIRALQEQLDSAFPGGRILVRQLEQGPPFDAPVEVRLFGPDLAVLQELGDEIRLVLSETGEVVHTRSDLTETVPKLALHFDEHEARMAGLSHNEIARQLFASLEGVESGSMMEATEEIPIRVRLSGNTRADPAQIALMELKPLTPRGRAEQGSPLSSLGELNLDSEVASIPRIDGRRVNEVRGYVTAGTLPDQVVSEFKERLAESDFALPPGYSLEYAGEAAERDEAVRGLMADIGILIALIIATLVTAFRSFRMAFIVAVVGGLSIGLGLFALWAFGFPFGFMGVVGTMGLVGLALNDGIVVMAGIRDDPEARAGNVQAITAVVMHRTRHIVATTLTTIAGFIPLVLAGGGFWPPVAITIAGGVGGATVLALFFVPSLYLIFIGLASPTEASEKLPESGRGRAAAAG